MIANRYMLFMACLAIGKRGLHQLGTRLASFERNCHEIRHSRVVILAQYFHFAGAVEWRPHSTALGLPPAVFWNETGAYHFLCVFEECKGVFNIEGKLARLMCEQLALSHGVSSPLTLSCQPTHLSSLPKEANKYIGLSPDQRKQGVLFVCLLCV